MKSKQWKAYITAPSETVTSLGVVVKAEQPLEFAASADAVRSAIDYVAPVGENEKLVAHALSMVQPFILANTA